MGAGAGVGGGGVEGRGTVWVDFCSLPNDGDTPYSPRREEWICLCINLTLLYTHTHVQTHAHTHAHG